MAVTGIILAYEPQIVDYAERYVRYVTPGEKALSPAAIIEEVRRQKPELKINALMLRSDPRASATVSAGKEGAALYVDPYTGQVLGKGSKLHDWMHTVEDIHRWLGNKPLGRPVTGVAVVAFFVLVVTGIYVWWPAKTMAFKPKLKGKARDWNWHNVIGFWLSPVLLVTTLTGMIMAHQWANALLFRATGNEPPAVVKPAGENASKPEKGKREGRSEEVEAVDIDAIAAKAQALAPAWVSINIRLPREEGKPVAVTIQEKLAAGVLGRSQLTWDAKNNDVVKWEPLSQANLGMKARMWVKYLHTGQAFGPLHQGLMGLGALGALFLVWTGFCMAWQRFIQFRRRKYV